MNAEAVYRTAPATPGLLTIEMLLGQCWISSPELMCKAAAILELKTNNMV